MNIWIIFGHFQIFLSRISSAVLAVSIWGNVTVNVSLEVASEAGLWIVIWLKGGIGMKICALDPL